MENWPGEFAKPECASESQADPGSHMGGEKGRRQLVRRIAQPNWGGSIGEPKDGPERGGAICSDELGRVQNGFGTQVPSQGLR